MSNRGTFIIDDPKIVQGNPEIHSIVVKWDQLYDRPQLENLYRQTEHMYGVENVARFKYAMIVEFFPHVISARKLAEDIQHLITLLKFQADVAIFLPKE